MASVHLPDICALCFIPGFSLRINNNCRLISTVAGSWVEKNKSVSIQDLDLLISTKIELLCSLCLTTADIWPLTVATKLTILLVLGEWDKHPVLVDNPQFLELWNYICKSTSLQFQTRFLYDLNNFGSARASLSKESLTLTLEEYVDIRRESSGVKIIFDLIEFAEGLDLSKEILDDPIIRSLRQDATDIIAWSIDLASFGGDYYHKRTHNIVSIIRVQHGITVQAAVNRASCLIKQKVANFCDNLRSLPSFDGYDDVIIATYVRGLQDCIVGAAHWIYQTERYFGQRSEDVKLFGWIFLNEGPDMN